MIVSMQVPRDVAARSVGENDSPRPSLSTGASVVITVPDGSCRASQRKSPKYEIEISTMGVV
jgi:hypothetical protein